MIFIPVLSVQMQDEAGGAASWVESIQMALTEFPERRPYLYTSQFNIQG
jgi:hypothetical protein